MAQEEPSWEAKKAALMQAYHANGDKMSGYGMFDATEPRSIKTDRIPPAPLPAPKVAELPTASGAPVESNVCTRKGLHKVFTRRGKSWRCK
jgi:hypothetical protein